MQNQSLISCVLSDKDSYNLAQKPNIQKAIRVERDKANIKKQILRCENRFYRHLFTSSYCMMSFHYNIERNILRIKNFTL